MKKRPMTFTEACDALSVAPHSICYDVKHDGSHGALVTLDGYIDSVSTGFFTNYDGYGLALDKNGAYLDNTRPDDLDDLPANCAYVLWFNK